MPKYYEISEAAAKRAKDMNSYSDYAPGSATAGYRAMVDEAYALAEKQKAQIGQARDGCAESELHRKADKGGENAPAAPPAQRIEQHGKHQREQQR